MRSNVRMDWLALFTALGRRMKAQRKVNMTAALVSASKEAVAEDEEIGKRDDQESCQVGWHPLYWRNNCNHVDRMRLSLILKKLNMMLS